MTFLCFQQRRRYRVHRDDARGGGKPGEGRPQDPETLADRRHGAGIRSETAAAGERHVERDLWDRGPSDRQSMGRHRLSGRW